MIVKTGSVQGKQIQTKAPATAARRARASRDHPRKVTAATDERCAAGDDIEHGPHGWTCMPCGKSFAKSPNQHIYAARKRVNARKAGAR